MQQPSGKPVSGAGRWFQCSWQHDDPAELSLKPCELLSAAKTPLASPGAAQPGQPGAQQQRVNLYVIPRISLLTRHARAKADVMTAFSLFHPHVVTIQDAVATQKLLCLITEPIHGGTLASLIGAKQGLPERAAKFLFQQLCTALTFCHARGVYIQHLTPERIFVDWAPGSLPILKLGDCGFVSGEQVPHTWTPEKARAISEWSAGYILHFMLYGEAPSLVAEAPNMWRPSAFMAAFAAHSCSASADWLPTSTAHGSVSSEARQVVTHLLCAPGDWLDGLLTSLWLQEHPSAAHTHVNNVCHRLSDARCSCALAGKVSAEVEKSLAVPMRSRSNSPSSPRRGLSWFRELQQAALAHIAPNACDTGTSQGPECTGSSSACADVRNKHQGASAEQSTMANARASTSSGDCKLHGERGAHIAMIAAALKLLCTVPPLKQHCVSADVAPGLVAAQLGSLPQQQPVHNEVVCLGKRSADEQLQSCAQAAEQHADCTLLHIPSLTSGGPSAICNKARRCEPSIGM